jgi:ketosteroid isomerase-like protein
MPIGMSDREDVIAAFEAFDSALKRRDADAIVDLFVDDPDVTLCGSALHERALGKLEIRGLLDRLFSTLPDSSVDRTFQQREVYVSGDVAWVNAAGSARWEPGGEPRMIPYRVTAVLVRTVDGWRWHTHNGSQPTEPDA